MRRRLWALGAIVAALVIVAAIPAAAGGAGKTILRGQTLVGVPTAFTGTKAPIRGVNGGGRAVGARLRAGRAVAGRLRVGQGQGPRHRSRPPRRRPPAPTRRPVFRVLVSCLTSAGAIDNVLSDAFPATTGLGAGDAEAELQLAIPDPCIAPIVFVTSNGGAWFASTGG